MPTTTSIVFSGGGSAGHVTPLIAIADAVTKLNPTVQPLFICADRKDETDVLGASKATYKTIHAGKFPRGLSLRLLTFPFLLVLSFLQSFRILRVIRPSLVVSKGGYVSVPVCLAAAILRIPIVLHASDSVPNLSDRFVGLFAKKICTGFPIEAFPAGLRRKAVQTGNPVRSMIYGGSKSAGQGITGFSGRRPVIMVIGGSQGARALNEAIDKNFDELIDLGDIIHLTGAGKGIDKSHARYFSKAYVVEELPHLYALADLVVTRAGAGTLSELAALRKPIIIVPLAGVAHDHQVRNAEILAELGAAKLLSQKNLDELPARIRSLMSSPDAQSFGDNLAKALPADAAAAIAKIVLDAA